RSRTRISLASISRNTMLSGCASSQNTLDTTKNMPAILSQPTRIRDHPPGCPQPRRTTGAFVLAISAACAFVDGGQGCQPIKRQPPVRKAALGGLSGEYG